MKKKLWKIFVLLLMLGITAACQPKTASLSAKAAWARPGSAGSNSAAYLILQNPLDSPDALVSASSDSADSVEIHMSSMDANSTMMMRPAGPVELPAQSAVELKPGGLHIMLVGLKNDLNTGGTITLTLHFEKADPLTLEIPIQESAP